jgi:hypothetical protein
MAFFMGAGMKEQRHLCSFMQARPAAEPAYSLECILCVIEPQLFIHLYF